jgi:hypothetical protein
MDKPRNRSGLGLASPTLRRAVGERVEIERCRSKPIEDPLQSADLDIVVPVEMAVRDQRQGESQDDNSSPKSGMSNRTSKPASSVMSRGVLSSQFEPPTYSNIPPVQQAVQADVFYQLGIRRVPASELELCPVGDAYLTGNCGYAARRALANSSAVRLTCIWGRHFLGIPVIQLNHSTYRFKPIVAKVPSFHSRLQPVRRAPAVCDFRASPP